jgi:hypothetical protein
MKSKIKNYLQAGGLFNPELMDHKEVSALIQECDTSLDKAIAFLEFFTQNNPPKLVERAVKQQAKEFLKVLKK